MRDLIAGKNGQLARAFIKRFEAQSLDFRAPDESVFDITDSAVARETVAAYKPDVIINCAAYNLVDRAEEDRDRAFSINTAGPQNLARAAAEHRAVLIHFGSDYVFDGAKESGLYAENDPVNPLNVYGASKRAGEERVREETDNFLILRLSWVFGEGKQNFIYKLGEWVKQNDYLKIACDEFSVPTSTETVVDITLASVHAGLRGLYHGTNSGYCSRYEWAKTVLDSLGIKKFVRPVSMDSFALPAKRPKFSAMTNASIAHVLGLSIPTWQEAVRSFLREGNTPHERKG